VGWGCAIENSHRNVYVETQKTIYTSFGCGNKKNNGIVVGSGSDRNNPKKF